MRPRDRLIARRDRRRRCVVGGVWLLLVSPERSQVSSLSTQIAAERAALTDGAGLARPAARDAVAAYVGHVHQIDAVMRAVPTEPRRSRPDQDDREARRHQGRLPRARRRLQQRARRRADRRSVSRSPSTRTTATSRASSSRVDALTTHRRHELIASGRLFTIQSVSLAPEPPSKHRRRRSSPSVYRAEPGGRRGATGATGAAGAAP